MTYFHKKTVRVGISLLLTFVSSWGLFAQTNITLDPACQSCPPSATLNSSSVTPVPTPMPSCGTVAGTYKVGTALAAANTITLSLTVVTAGAYNITTTATNGMTFTGAGTFAGTGTQSVILTGSGTPTASGTTAVLVQYGGSTCSVAITVASNAPTAAAPIVGSANGGSLGGKTCFDVAISNDNVNGCALLTSRTPQKADFTLAATNQQVYTFTPLGTVSNVRFSYVNTNGNVITAITGGNAGNNITTAVTATVSFNTGLNAPATGLTNTNALTADIYAIYNDGATNNGVDRQVKITPKVKDCACCGAWSFANSVQGATKTWLEFMCHNLGADESKDPFIYNSSIYGGMYQWGRMTDGHEIIMSKPTPTASPTATPNHNYYINSASTWTTAANLNSLWGDGFIEPWLANTAPFTQKKGPNDPCPAGWKVPTHKQWSSLVVGVAGGTNADGAAYFPITGAANVITAVIDPAMSAAGANGVNLGPLLYLPFTGQRGSFSTVSVGQYGNYWSSSLHTNGGVLVSTFGASASGIGGKGSQSQNMGYPVRCMIDK
jgi:uncharacterized protein (TIGR02145 family)